MQLHIHISTYKETTDIIIFCLTHFKQGRFTIIASSSIVFYFLSTTTYLSNCFRTIVCFFQIIGRIHVKIGITVRIQAGRMIVNISIRVIGRQSIISTSLVVERHIFCRSQIFRIRFWSIKAGIRMNIDIKITYFSSFSGNRDNAFSRTRTV